MAKKSSGEIVIDCKPDGTWSVEVEGVCGPECESLTAGIRKAMGGESEHNRTDQYREKPRDQKKTLKR